MTRDPHNDPKRIYPTLALGMALFGSATPISKLVGDAFPAFLASGARMLTAIVVLLPIAVVVSRSSDAPLFDVPLRELTKTDIFLLLGIGLVGTFGFTLFLFYGLREAPGAVSAVVMGTAPAVTAIGSRIFFKDEIDRFKMLGIGLAVAGVVAVNLGPTGGSGGNVLMGAALVLAAVCCEAAYTLLGKRLSADLSPLSMTLLATLIAGVAFLPLALVQAPGLDLGEVAAGDWVALGWWGAGTMGLGSIVWFTGVKRASGVTASAFMAVMPVSALILSYLLLDESFRIAHAVGMTGVLLGLGAVMYGNHRAMNSD